MRAVVEIVGSLNIDLVTTAERIPGPGETLTGSSFSTGFGGKGANQAVACARLLRHNVESNLTRGAEVLMVGGVGDDQFGQDYVNHLQSECINTEAVAVKAGTKTGTAVILVEEPTGENRILVNPGANGQFGAEDVRLRAKGSDTVNYVLFQLEVPLSTVFSAIRTAKQQNKTVVFNPAPAVVLSDEIFANVDVLILNESEAAIFSGIPEDQVGESLSKVAGEIFKRGVSSCVIITLGSKGVFWMDKESNNRRQEGKIIPAQRVQVVDTTGAGDAFVGAFVAYSALHPDGKTSHAIEYAVLAASFTIQKLGAQTAIPFKGDIKF